MIILILYISLLALLNYLALLTTTPHILVHNNNNTNHDNSTLSPQSHFDTSIQEHGTYTLVSFSHFVDPSTTLNHFFDSLVSITSHVPIATPMNTPSSPILNDSYDNILLSDESPNNIPHVSPGHNESPDIPEPYNPPLRHSTRASNPPSYLSDYHYYRTTNNPSMSKSHTQYIANPLSSVISYDKCFPAYNHFFRSISIISEPKTYKQVIKLDCWINAMDAELKALAENQTWIVVDLPNGKIPLDVDGFIKSDIRQMDPLKYTNLGLWQKDILK